MATQYLLNVPKPRVVADPRIDEKGNQVRNEHGQIIVDVKEIVSPWFAYDLALQSVTSGPKLFEVWALRKRIKEVFFQDKPFESASYMILSEDEKEILRQGFTTIDWTFNHKHTFWVEWEQLFDSVNTIPVFDEKAPPVEYLEWSLEWDKAVEARAAADREAKRKILAEKEAAIAKRNSGIKRLGDERLQAALDAKIAEGKLGNAATIEDLPSVLVGDIRAQAATDYDANPGMFDAPVAADIVEAEVVTLPLDTTDEVVEG